MKKEQHELVKGPCRKRDCNANCSMFTQDPYEEIPDCLACNHSLNYHVQLRLLGTDVKRENVKLLENPGRQKRTREYENREYPECIEVPRSLLVPEENSAPDDPLESLDLKDDVDFGEEYQPHFYPNLSQSNTPPLPRPNFELIFDELLTTSRAGLMDDVKNLLEK